MLFGWPGLTILPASTNDKDIRGAPLKRNASLAIGPFSVELCGMKRDRQAHPYENAKKRQKAIR